MPTESPIRSLQVLPSRSADLCFSSPGVIARQNFDHATGSGPAYIGQTVQGFDFRADLYSRFGEFLTNAADPRYPGDPAARLKFDSFEIDETMSTPAGGNLPPFLFALRNESLAAVLDQAVSRRQGMHFQKFKHAAAIQTAMMQTIPNVLNLLNQLQTEATTRFNALDAAHAGSGASPVVTSVKSTTSVSPNYNVRTLTQQRNMVSVNAEFDDPNEPVLDTRVIDELETDQSKKHVQTHRSDRLAGFQYALDSAGAWQALGSGANNEYYDSQITDTKTTGDQLTASENPAYFHPRLDNSIAHKQFQAGLLGEKMNQSIANLTAPDMAQIISDERAATDAEVRRLQAAFAETYLTAPFDGLVTAVFKDVGESVQAGEPVMRIENDTIVFLAGRIQHRGILRVGQDLTVRAKDLYETGQATLDIAGKLRGIRGHAADDDEWEVLIECRNPVDGGGRRLLPIYFDFDRDTTLVLVP